MKSSVETLPRIADAEKSRVSVISELIKARLTSLVLLTTLVGFYMGTRGPVNYWLMLHALLGTALVACGAAALNQLIEQALKDSPSVRITQARLTGAVAQAEAAGANLLPQRWLNAVLWRELGHMVTPGSR